MARQQRCEERAANIALSSASATRSGDASLRPAPPACHGMTSAWDEAAWEVAAARAHRVHEIHQAALAAEALLSRSNLDGLETAHHRGTILKRTSILEAGS
jgi:hypothetical protein